MASMPQQFLRRRTAVGLVSSCICRVRQALGGLVLPIAMVLSVVSAPTALAIEVAIDVGHTLAASGAVSARGGREFDFNRVLAGKVARALANRGISVRPVNFDGRIASLEARPLAAAGSDFFFSVHHDSVQENLLEPWQWAGSPQTYSDRYIGYALFVSRDNPQFATSLRCASIIGAWLRHQGFVGAVHHADSQPGHERPFADADNAVYYYDKLIVLYRTTLPAVLFEAGIIKHRAEEMALRDPVLQERMADALATGMAACLTARDEAIDQAQ